MSETFDANGVTVRVYRAVTPGAGLVWTHGGGFAAGSLDMPEADAVGHALADLGVTVVSVDYRLVSGSANVFPAASDDVLTAWSWAIAHADELGIDTARLAIGGASAGANIVTGAVLRMLGHEPEASTAVLPASVFLAYPTLHAVQPAPDATLRAALDADPDADRFGPDAVRGMYERYLGSPVEGAPITAIPGHATAADLAGFPPVLMINDEVDELRVSGEAFAETLRAAGISVDLSVEPSTVHGHLNQPDHPGFTATLGRVAERLISLNSIH